MKELIILSNQVRFHILLMELRKTLLVLVLDGNNLD